MPETPEQHRMYRAAKKGDWGTASAFRRERAERRAAGRDGQINQSLSRATPGAQINNARRRRSNVGAGKERYRSRNEV